MDNIEKIGIQLEAKVDKKTFDNAEKDVEIFARDTQKKLDKAVLLDLEINKTKLQIQLQDLNKTLAKAKKEGNEELRFNTQLDINKLSSSLTEAKRQFNNYVNTGDTGTSRLQAKFNQVTSEIKKSRDELASLGKNTSGFDKILKKADELQKQLAEGKISSDDFKKGLNNIQNEGTNATKTLTGLGKITAGLFLGNKIVDGITGLVGLTAQAEQTQVVFTNLTGSVKEANDIIGLIRDFSKTTPFEFTELADVSKKLMSIAGVTKDNLIPTLTALGDLASSQGKSISQAVEAYNDAIVGEFERLKEFGVRASVEGDKVKFTFQGQTTEVAKTQEAIDGYIRSISELQGVSGSMEAQSKTLAGQWSNLKDIVSTIAINIGTSLLPILKSLLESVLNGINTTIKYKDTLLEFGKVIVSIIGGYGLLGLANILKTLPALFGTVTLSARTATAGIGLLSGGLAALRTLLGPLNLAFIALSGVIYGGIKLYDLYTENVNDTSTAIGILTTDLKNNLKAQQELDSQYANGTISLEEYNKKTDELKNKQDILNIAIEQSKGTVYDYKTAIDSLANSSYETNTEGYITERTEIEKNIKATLDLLNAKKQAGLVEAQQVSANLNKAFDKTKTTGAGALNINQQNTSSITFEKVNGQFVARAKLTEEQIKAQKENNRVMEEQNKISSEITQKQKELAGIDESIASIRSGVDYKGSYEGITSSAGKSATTLNSLNKTLSTLKEKLGGVDVGSKEFKNLQNEISSTENKINSLTQTSKSSGSSRKKTEEELQAEIEKIKQEALKKEIERQENLLKTEYANKITSVKNSELTEVEKAKKIVALNEELQDKIKKINIELIDDEVEKAKKILEIEEKANDKRKDLLDTLKDGYDKISDVLQDSIDKSKDNIDELKDKISDLSGVIKDLNEDIANLTTEKTTDILNRNVEITQRQAELQAELNDLKKEGINIDLASQIGETSLKSMQGDTSFGGENTVDNLLKVIELQKELTSINQEQAKIQELVKNGDLKQSELDEALRVSKLSDTEKILLNYDTEKAKIETKIALKETELKAEKKKLESEYVAYNSLVLRQSQVDQNYKNIKMGIEKEITDNLYQEGVKREEILESLRLKALEVAEALKQAGLTSSTDTKSSTDDKSSTTNSKVINQTINISNEVDGQALLNNLNSKI